MIILLWSAFGVAVVALLIAAVIRTARSRNVPGEPGSAASLIAVASEIQDAVRWHLDQRQRARAVRIVRRSAGLGHSEAVAVVDALAAERRVPASYAESAVVLAAEYPELSTRLRALVGEGQMISAMWLLRQHVPVTIVRAKHLIDTLAR